MAGVVIEGVVYVTVGWGGGATEAAWEIMTVMVRGANGCWEMGKVRKQGVKGVDGRE